MTQRIPISRPTGRCRNDDRYEYHTSFANEKQTPLLRQLSECAIGANTQPCESRMNGSSVRSQPLKIAVIAFDLSDASPWHWVAELVEQGQRPRVFNLMMAALSSMAQMVDDIGGRCTAESADRVLLCLNSSKARERAATILPVLSYQTGIDACKWDWGECAS